MERERCYFCNSTDLVFTHEHYVFCKDCMALYTTLIIREWKCGHLNIHSPVVLHQPIYAGLKNRPHILLAPENHTPSQYCSVCKKGCLADGW